MNKTLICICTRRGL